MEVDVQDYKQIPSHKKTGTEQAIQILQAASTSSLRSLNDADIAILETIGQLEAASTSSFRSLNDDEIAILETISQLTNKRQRKRTIFKFCADQKGELRKMERGLLMLRKPER